MYCHYYQAKVLRKKAWFVVGSFRNEENIAFIRALESSQDLFEFFVPDGYKEHFLSFIKYLQEHGYIFEFEEKPNRIKEILSRSK